MTATGPLPERPAFPSTRRPSSWRIASLILFGLATLFILQSLGFRPRGNLAREEDGFLVLGVYFLIAWLFTVLGSIAGWVVADEKIDELPWFYGFLEVGVLILLVLAIGSFVISAIAPLAMGAQEGIGATYPVLVALGVSLAQIFALCFLLLLIDIGKTLHGIKQEHCGTSSRRTSRRAMKLILALAVFTPGFALLGAFSTLDSRLPLWWGLTIGALVGLLFGMIFGGYRARWLDYLFGQKIGHRENSLP